MRRARVEAAFPVFLSIKKSVYREVSIDGGAEVGVLTDNIVFVVVDSVDWWCLDMLLYMSRDVRLLQIGDQSEVLTCLEEVVHQ